MSNIRFKLIIILGCFAIISGCSEKSVYSSHDNKTLDNYTEFIKLAISKTIWENINITNCDSGLREDSAYVPCVYNTFSYTEPSWNFAANSFRDISGPITIRMKHIVDTTDHIKTVYKGKSVNIPFVNENYSVRYTPPFISSDKKYIGGLIINSLGEILAYGIEFKDGAYKLKYIFQITS